MCSKKKKKKSTRIGKTWRKKSKNVPIGLLDEKWLIHRIWRGYREMRMSRKCRLRTYALSVPTILLILKRKKIHSSMGKQEESGQEKIWRIFDIQQSGSCLQENVMGGHFSTSNLLSREVRPRGTPALETNSQRTAKLIRQSSELLEGWILNAKTQELSSFYKTIDSRAICPQPKASWWVMLKGADRTSERYWCVGATGSFHSQRTSSTSGGK